MTPLSQLNTHIDEYIAELADLTDAARISEAMQAYLDTCARFHRYSWHNTLLIMWAKPEATQVAGYKKWLDFNRYVRKGEKGIAILAPIWIKCSKDDPHSDTVLRFRIAHVFDLSQTEGDPLPEGPDWKSPEQDHELTCRLIALAESRGIQVTVQSLSGDKQGASTGGHILIAPTAGTKTLIHELAHELLHQGQCQPSREAMETEAEAVAYVVARHFGLPDLNSPNYLALWNADSSILRAHFERIGACARQLITALQGEETPILQETQQ